METEEITLEEETTLPGRDTLIVKPKVASQSDCLRPTRAEVDLDAIAFNFRQLSGLGNTPILCVIKADAYGHGVVPVAKRLQNEGAFAFGVALAEEGFELRAAGITAPILVLNGVHGNAHKEVIAQDLTPVIYEMQEAKRFHEACSGQPVKVHLKIDTGMHRLGIPFGRVPDFVEKISKLKLDVTGIMTHFATADSDRSFTELQTHRFREAVTAAKQHGVRPARLHAANSAAFFRHPETHFDMVRPGIALFGYPMGVKDNTPHSLQLKPALKWRTEIVSLRTISAGDAVGYDGTFVARRSTRIATLPIGYGDGLLRSASNKAIALVSGQRCPFIGNVAMDLSAIDITRVMSPSIGDEVVLVGSQGDETLTAFDLADAMGTLPYEVLTNVSRRVPRFY